MPSIFSADWRNEINDELSGKQPLNATLSQLANNGTLNLFGGQIIFPATQIPSANPNTLDDYEEGSWTPGYSAATGSFGSISYDAVTLGAYTKIGRVVIISGRIRTTSVTVGTASGALRVHGLPFATPATGYAAVSVPFSAGWTSNAPLGAIITPSVAYFSPYSKAAIGGSSAAVTVADMNPASTNDMIFGGAYVV